MRYRASALVILADESTQTVEAEGDSRNDALRNLENAAAGINVVAVAPWSVRTEHVERSKAR